MDRQLTYFAECQEYKRDFQEQMFSDVDLQKNRQREIIEKKGKREKNENQEERYRLRIASLFERLRKQRETFDLRVRCVAKRQNIRYNTPYTERHKGILRTDEQIETSISSCCQHGSVRKGKENGDRRKRNREYHLLLRRCNTKNSAVCNLSHVASHLSLMNFSRESYRVTNASLNQ